MDEPTIQSMLSRLGYSQLWLDSGVLTESALIEQIKQLTLEQDTCTEHYRYRTLSNYVNAQALFDDRTLWYILQFMEKDTDKTMASSATILLLKSKALTNEQFDTVTHALRIFGDWVVKYIDKEKKERMEKHSGLM